MVSSPSQAAFAKGTIPGGSMVSGIFKPKPVSCACRQIMAIHCGSTKNWCWFQGERSGSWSQWKIRNSSILHQAPSSCGSFGMFEPTPFSHRLARDIGLPGLGSWQNMDLDGSGVQRPVETRAKPRWLPKIPWIFHGNFPMQMTIWRYKTPFSTKSISAPNFTMKHWHFMDLFVQSCLLHLSVQYMNPCIQNNQLCW